MNIYINRSASSNYIYLQATVEERVIFWLNQIVDQPVRSFNEDVAALNLPWLASFFGQEGCRLKYTNMLKQLSMPKKRRLLEVAVRILDGYNASLLILALWDQLGDISKILIIGVWKWRSIPYRLTIPLFRKEHASIAIQSTMLKVCLRRGHERLFHHIWQVATHETKRRWPTGEDCWISMAIGWGKKGIIRELVNEKEQVQQHLPGVHSPLSIAESEIHLDETTYKKMKNHDDGFTKAVRLFHVFSNAFALKGALYEGMNFESLFREITYMKKGVYNLITMAPNKDEKGFWEEVLDVIRHWISRPIQTLPKRTGWTLIRSGWISHGTSCLLSLQKKLFITIDGSKQSISNGIRVYKMRGKISERAVLRVIQVLVNMQGRVMQEIGMKYFTYGIQKDLNCSLVAKFECKQDVGNCLWFSVEWAIRTVIMLQNAERMRLDFVADYEWLVQLSESKQNAFSGEVRRIIAEVGIQIMKKYPMICDRNDIISQLRNIKPLGLQDKTMRRLEGFIKAFIPSSGYKL